MRNLILASLLTLATAPAFAVDAQACRDAGEFTRTSAQARDNGVSESVLQQAMRDTIGAEERELYSLLVQLVFSARNGTPSQLAHDVRESCIKGAWYK